MGIVQDCINKYIEDGGDYSLLSPDEAGLIDVIVGLTRQRDVLKAACEKILNKTGSIPIATREMQLDARAALKKCEEL